MQIGRRRFMIADKKLFAFQCKVLIASLFMVNILLLLFKMLMRAITTRTNRKNENKYTFIL